MIKPDALPDVGRSLGALYGRYKANGTIVTEWLGRSATACGDSVDSLVSVSGTSGASVRLRFEGYVGRTMSGIGQ